MTKNIFEEESTSETQASGGDAKIRKQARQLAYDVRYKVKQSLKKGEESNDASLKRAYLQQLNSSPAPGAVKRVAKTMLVGESYDFVDITETAKESVDKILSNVFVKKTELEDADGNSAFEVTEFVFGEEKSEREKKYKVRVTDKKGKKTYVRMADRKKIGELRKGDEVSSVEMTGYGVPNEEKGKKKDFDGDGKLESPEAEYKGSKDKAIKKAVAKEGYQRDPERLKKDKTHSKQPDPSKDGFTGIGNMSIKDIMKMNKKMKKEEVVAKESVGSAIDKGLGAVGDTAKVAGKAAVGTVKVAGKVAKGAANVAGRVAGTPIGVAKAVKKGFKSGTQSESVGSAVDKALGAVGDTAKVAGKAAVGGVKVAGKVAKGAAKAAGHIAGTPIGVAKSIKKGWKAGTASESIDPSVQSAVDALDTFDNLGGHQIDEAQSSYDKARKAAARRAADRNAKRRRGEMGGRMERETYTNEAGTRMHHKGYRANANEEVDAQSIIANAWHLNMSEHHQVDANGKVIEHEDTTPSSVEEGVIDIVKKGAKRHAKAVEKKKIKNRKAVPYAALAAQHEPEGEVIDEKCWDGYAQKGMKKKGDRVVPNCVKEEDLQLIWEKVRKKAEKKAIKRWWDDDGDGIGYEKGEVKEDHYRGTGEKVVARTKKFMDKKGQKGAPGLDAMKARTAEHKAKRGVKEEVKLEGYYDSAVAASKAASKGNKPKVSLKDRIKSVAKKAIASTSSAAGKAVKVKSDIQAAPGKAKKKVTSYVDRVKGIAKAGYKSGRGPVEKTTTYRGAGAGRKEKIGEDFVTEVIEKDNPDANVKKIDVMKGKNKVKINPNMGEQVETDTKQPEDVGLKQKERQANMLKKRVLMQKLKAVRSGAGDSIMASHTPQGEVVEASGCGTEITNKGKRKVDPKKNPVIEAKVDQGRSDYGKASIRNYRRSGPGHGEPAMFDSENKRGKTIDKRREEHKARRGVKGAKVPAYKVSEENALEKRAKENEKARKWLKKDAKDSGYTDIALKASMSKGAGVNESHATAKKPSERAAIAKLEAILKRKEDLKKQTKGVKEEVIPRGPGGNPIRIKDRIKAAKGHIPNKGKPTTEEVVSELNRYGKETGKATGSINKRAGTPVKTGGSTDDKALTFVRNMIRKETGKPSGQQKKVKGEKGRVQYGDRKTTPADSIAKRRQSAKDADAAMRDTRGT